MFGSGKAAAVAAADNDNEIFLLVEGYNSTKISSDIPKKKKNSVWLLQPD